MSEQRQRFIFGGLAIALAIASVVFLAHGIGIVGVLCFALHIVLLGLGTRPAKKELSTTTQSPAALKPASAPPDGHVRFTLVVEPLEPARIAQLWTDLCRPDHATTEPIRLLFRDFTVLEGNRFRFRSGDPKATAALLSDVLSSASGVPVRTSLEPAAERTPAWS